MDGIDKTRALDLAVSFVGDEWKLLNEDDIAVSILSGGYSSRLFIVEDVSKTVNDNTKKKFLVRLYGGKLMDKDDICKAGKSEASEGIVFLVNDMQGLGPRLLGVFDGGRVEEFVPSHRLTEIDLADENISKELIRKLARFHALQLPISKKKRDLLHISATYQDQYVRANLLKLTERTGVNPDDCKYLDEEYLAEHTFLRSFETKVGGRLVFCHGDLNKNNILVRDTPDRFNERVMLIDYELAAMDYRGTDLAGLLWAKIFEMKDNGEFQIVCDWPDEDYRRMIVVEYLNETKKLNCFELDENGVDSVDHVLMEMDFFVMYGLQLFKGLFKRVLNNDFLCQQTDAMIESWLGAISAMATLYAARRKYFVERYAEII